MLLIAIAMAVLDVLQEPGGKPCALVTRAIYVMLNAIVMMGGFSRPFIPGEPMLGWRCLRDNC
ncbi:MAG: hypothetical protein ABR607_14515 [Pyrinomonadaceae bacterium]